MLSTFTLSLLEPALCRPEGMWCDAVLRMMARKILLFGSWSEAVFCSACLSTVSVPVCLFQVDAETMLYRVDSDVYLQTNEDW